MPHVELPWASLTSIRMEGANEARQLLELLSDGEALVAHTERVRGHQEEAMHLVRVVGHQAEVTHTRFTELHKFKDSETAATAVADLPHKSRGRQQRPSDRPVSNQVLAARPWPPRWDACMGLHGLGSTHAPAPSLSRSQACSPRSQSS